MILFSRHDIHSKVGLQPSRPSASTQAVSSSSSSGLGSLARGQTGGQGDLGQEQEVTQDMQSDLYDLALLQIFSLLIIDQHTFETVHCHTFMPMEYTTSIMSCKLGDDPNPYYVVGTGIIHPEESEPKTGRLVVFSWADGKLTQVS